LASPNIFTPKPNMGSGLVWLVTISPQRVESMHKKDDASEKKCAKLYYIENSISISYKFRYIKIMYIYEKMCLIFISYMAWCICGSKIWIKVTC